MHEKTTKNKKQLIIAMHGMCVMAMSLGLAPLFLLSKLQQ
jgi:hypothetical protein